MGGCRTEADREQKLTALSVYALLWRKGLKMLLSLLSRLEGVASDPRERSGRQHRHGTLRQPGHNGPLH